MGQGITSRRGFLKASAVAGLGVVGLGALGGCAPQQAGDATGAGVSASDVSWDGAFDVVVVGFGAAGAASAISAAEAGARVLIVDKAPEGHEGGNSRYCAQLFVSITDKAEGLKHYQALRGNRTTSDDVLEAYVDGMVAIKDTLVGWGADASKMLDMTDMKISNLTVEYPELPGSAAIRTNLIDGVLMRAGLWRFLKKGVVARKDMIDCWYESPAQALIRDAQTGVVAGVQIQHEGKSVNIAAKNGVVMALGGFENGPEYTEAYLGYPVINPIGTLYNEGDGIAMTQAIGAKLWHMASWESNGIGLSCQADRVRNLGTIDFFRTGSVVLVGGDAKRYVAEDKEQRHGHLNIGGTWMIPARPDRNIFIFDAAHVQAVEKPYGNWSSDLSKEIESGKVVQAATLDELASKLSLDAAALVSTIELFNASAASGIDAFGREAVNMTAFGDGPFYGFEVQVSVLNTQGGPERTAKAEIVDTEGEPIPHLYSAGEFGGVSANMYQGGGNIAECVVFGKIAGENAAASKDDALEVDADGLAFVPGCGETSVYDQTPDASGLSDGQALGVGEGLGGPIWVKVSSDNGKITQVEIMHSMETEGVGTVAISDMPALIMAAGSSEGVDTISGATFTSEAILAAVADAQAKLS